MSLGGARAAGGGPVRDSAASARADAIEDLVDYCLATTYESLPEAIAVIAKQQVLDTIGVALAGYAADGVRQLREFTAAMGGRPESRIWGSPVAVPAHEAARVNGAMAHALDYDDTHEKSYVHPPSSPYRRSWRSPKKGRA